MMRPKTHRLLAQKPFGSQNVFTNWVVALLIWYMFPPPKEPPMHMKANAVDSVASVAATLRDVEGWTASLQWRYLGSGALAEDNSVRSLPASTFNLRVTRAFGDRASLTLDVFNLFDREVNDIQYFYDSQLPGEASPVADRHVHPAEPRSLRLTLQASF